MGDDHFASEVAVCIEPLIGGALIAGKTIVFDVEDFIFVPTDKYRFATGFIFQAIYIGILR
jgi:hypothetical protein